ncbi:MAG: hypothetical protein WAT79_06605 [Saprospiraceae bacterium]
MKFFSRPFRIKLQFVLLACVIGFSAYSYIYLDMQEPINDVLGVNSFVKSSIQPGKDTVLVIVKALQNLFGPA